MFERVEWAEESEDDMEWDSRDYTYMCDDYWEGVDMDELANDEESTELLNPTRICPWCKNECVEGFDFNYDEGMCDFCYDTEKGLNYED